MKTRIFAWLCLTVSLGLACSTFVRWRAHRNVSPEVPDLRNPPERVERLGRRNGNDANQATATACSLARAGNIEQAWQWCETLSPELLAECAPLVASIQATTDPRGAWEKVASLTDESLRLVCQKAVLRSASDENFQKLAELAATLSDATERETMLGEIVSRWALQDPAALSQWPRLAEMPRPVRDLAASHLVHQGDSLNRSPEVAGAWAESIEDAGLRTAAMETATREWSATDREAAREFVRRSSRLDAAAKNSILTSLAEETPP